MVDHVLALSLLLLSACTDTTGPEEAVPPPSIQNVTVTPATGTLEIGYLPALPSGISHDGREDLFGTWRGLVRAPVDQEGYMERIAGFPFAVSTRQGRLISARGGRLLVMADARPFVAAPFTRIAAVELD